MPLTLQKIAARRATVVFTYEGEAVTLDYRPEAITANLQSRVLDIQALVTRDYEAGKRAIDALVLELVAGWDLLTVEDGPVVPLTPEALFPLSADFEGHCVAALVEDARMGERNGARPSTPSVSPLSQAGMPQVSRRTRRNGTR